MVQTAVTEPLQQLCACNVDGSFDGQHVKRCQDALALSAFAFRSMYSRSDIHPPP